MARKRCKPEEIVSLLRSSMSRLASAPGFAPRSATYANSLSARSSSDTNATRLVRQQRIDHTAFEVGELVAVHRLALTLSEASITDSLVCKLSYEYAYLVRSRPKVSRPQKLTTVSVKWW